MATVYTQLTVRSDNGVGKLLRWVGNIVFTSVTYSNGLAVTGSSMGMSNIIEQLEILGDSTNSTSVYKWDSTNKTIRMYVVASGGLIENSGSITATVQVSAVGW